MNTSLVSIEGEWIEVVHIQEMAHSCHRSVQSLRYLCQGEKATRPLKHIYDRSRILIPFTEVLGYPFVKQGKRSPIYHYNREGEQYDCVQCTVGDKCEARIKADALELKTQQLSSEVI